MPHLVFATPPAMGSQPLGPGESSQHPPCISDRLGNNVDQPSGPGPVLDRGLGGVDWADSSGAKNKTQDVICAGNIVPLIDI